MGCSCASHTSGQRAEKTPADDGAVRACSRRVCWQTLQEAESSVSDQQVCVCVCAREQPALFHPLATPSCCSLEPSGTLTAPSLEGAGWDAR